jgi:hypothetical protein
MPDRVVSGTRSASRLAPRLAARLAWAWLTRMRCIIVAATARKCARFFHCVRVCVDTRNLASCVSAVALSAWPRSSLRSLFELLYDELRRLARSEQNARDEASAYKLALALALSARGGVLGEDLQL